MELMYKTKPYNINEKEILDIVAAKGSYLSSISENLEEVPPHKESSSRAESKKTITDEEVKKYIEALLNNFSSNRRKPLHIDAQVYECISDIVWAVRRKDFTVSGVQRKRRHDKEDHRTRLQTVTAVI